MKTKIPPAVFVLFATVSCSSNLATHGTDSSSAEVASTPLATHAGKQVIVPTALQATYDELQFAPAVRAGGMLYLSGVVIQLGEGETDAEIRPAVERGFDEIESTLSEAGADWSDVVDVTSYLTDLDRQIGPLWEIKAERVPAPYPAWTAIGIDRLFGGDRALIEIKVTAYLPSDRAH